MTGHELDRYRKNVFSQFGEDGIIEEIFARIGTKSKMCFEAGSWDGYHMSNTANLWHNQKWKATLVEADEERYRASMRRVRGLVKTNRESEMYGNRFEDQVWILNKRVEPGYLFPPNLDLLSLDIDGNEWHILCAMTVEPRVIVVEYNPCLPPHIEMIGKLDRPVGSSLQAFVRLLEFYDLVYATETNAFFTALGLNKFERFNPLSVIRYGYQRFLCSDYLGNDMAFGPEIYGGPSRGQLRASDFWRIQQ